MSPDDGQLEQHNQQGTFVIHFDENLVPRQTFTRLPVLRQPLRLVFRAPSHAKAAGLRLIVEYSEDSQAAQQLKYKHTGPRPHQYI